MDVHEALKTSEKLIASKLIFIKLKNRLVRKISATLEINVFLHSKWLLLLRFVCYCLMKQMLSRFIIVLKAHFGPHEPRSSSQGSPMPTLFLVTQLPLRCHRPSLTDYFVYNHPPWHVAFHTRSIFLYYTYNYLTVCYSFIFNFF